MAVDRFDVFLVNPVDKARLAKKLAQGQPLSEIIIADREDRA